jgi:outer membrane protein OmpA-like peptidoglycan-associated protein
MKTISAFLMAFGVLWAQAPQAPNPTQQSSTTENAARIAAGSMPIYRVTVVERTTKAINYHNRGGATKIDFRGTPLLPKAHGQAKVESKQGYIEIEVEFRELQAASAYGPEYLTYVMWAITPEGRATNLGEVLLNGTNSKLDVTTELQSFGLIVTAEPYFAVTQPSDVVVMENEIRQDTQGTVQQVDAKYELLKRGQYILNVNPADLKPAQLDRNTPLELYEARNAVQIARWTGASQYAAETFQKAVTGLANAEGYLKGKTGRKPIATVAREAVQMAEDARIITIKKMEEERLANERQAGVDREARAESGRAAAQSETDRVAREAEGARVAALAEAERVKRERDAQTAAAQVEANRLKLESDARLAVAQTETDRLKRENETQTAAAQVEADRLKRENEAQRASAQADLDRAGREKAQAETEKAELRARLLIQFNAILQTRDTARGLIVNMSDVLFDTAKYSLRPEAREKLAKVSGILAGHPGLRMQVEGHTDSVGGDDYNQQLSEQRAGSVRDYLTQAGIPVTSVTARGFGKTQPVASNDTGAGRQQNRRVELVISGDIIGADIRPSPFLAVN